MSRKGLDIKSNNIRRYRKLRYLRQRDIAKLLGIKSHNDVYRWERGQKLPSLQNALKLSYILQCPVEVLFFDHYQALRKQIALNQLE